MKSYSITGTYLVGERTEFSKTIMHLSHTKSKQEIGWKQGPARRAPWDFNEEEEEEFVISGSEWRLLFICCRAYTNYSQFPLIVIMENKTTVCMCIYAPAFRCAHLYFFHYFLFSLPGCCRFLFTFSFFLL